MSGRLWQAGFLALLVALVGLLPSYELLTLNQHMFLAANVLALNFCLGLSGQASLAQGAFCGLGAYASVLLHDAFPQASLAILPLVALGAYGLGYLVSYPLEKLHEGFLAMATLGLALIFNNLAVSLADLTGGPDGRLVRVPLSVAGFALAGDRPNGLALVALLAGGLWTFQALKTSRLGRALLASKVEPSAAAACGVSGARLKSMAFGLSAALAALAGAVHAHYAGFIAPGQFGLDLAMKTLLYLVIGGPGRLLTPVIAVLVLEGVLGKAEFLGEGRTLFHGLLLAGALLAPQLWRRLRP